MGPQDESMIKNGISIIDRMSMVILLPEYGDISDSSLDRGHGEYSPGDTRDRVPRFLSHDEPGLRADAERKADGAPHRTRTGSPEPAKEKYFASFRAPQFIKNNYP